MGLFGDVGKIFNRAVTALGTGGISEIARALNVPVVTPLLEKLYGLESPVVGALAGSVAGPWATVAISAVKAFQSPQTSFQLPTGTLQFIPTGLSQPTYAKPQGGSNMALFGDFGGLVSTGLQALGGLGGGLGAVGQLGSGLLQSFTPQPVAQPMVIGQQPVYQEPTLVGGEMVRGLSSPAMKMIAPILIQIAKYLGRKSITLSAVISMIRKMGKLLGPAAVSIALGISVAQLAQLITANAARKRRRMNSANVHALRRAHRRVESFHRICRKNDELRTGRGRGRGIQRGKSCGERIVNVK